MNSWAPYTTVRRPFRTPGGSGNTLFTVMAICRRSRNPVKPWDSLKHGPGRATLLFWILYISLCLFPVLSRHLVSNYFLSIPLPFLFSGAAGLAPLFFLFPFPFCFTFFLPLHLFPRLPPFNYETHYLLLPWQYTLPNR